MQDVMKICSTQQLFPVCYVGSINMKIKEEDIFLYFIKNHSIGTIKMLF